MTLLLDTHVLAWWAMSPERVSGPAAAVIEAADELAVAAITWWELAWLVNNGRIVSTVPARAWISRLARDVRTAPLTDAIAVTSVELPDVFPRDPADRLIWATAVENGWRLVTSDRRLRAADPEGAITVW